MIEAVSSSPPPEKWQLEESAHPHSFRRTVAVIALGATAELGIGVVAMQESWPPADHSVTTPKASPCQEVPATAITAARGMVSAAIQKARAHKKEYADVVPYSRAEDEVIRLVAEGNRLTTVDAYPTFTALWSSPPDVEHDLATAQGYMSQYGITLSLLTKKVASRTAKGDSASMNPFTVADPALTPIKFRFGLEGLIGELHRFPKEFVKEIDLKQIKIGESDGALGLASSKSGTIYIDMNSPGVLPHEAFHLTDAKECGNNPETDPGYNALNPPTFSYAGNPVRTPASIELARKQKKPNALKKSVTYSEYGKEDIIEDKADQGARLIGSRIHQIIGLKSKIMKKKFFYLAGRLLQFDQGKQYLQYFSELSTLDEE